MDFGLTWRREKREMLVRNILHYDIIELSGEHYCIFLTFKIFNVFKDDKSVLKFICDPLYDIV